MKVSRLLGAPALPFALLAGGGCGDSTATPLGLQEPIRFGYTVDSASLPSQFFGGELPEGDGPAVVGIDIGLNVVVEGQVKKRDIGVRLRQPALAVAARLRGLGTGYWVSRVSLVEVLSQGEVRSDVFFDMSPNLPPGQYEIEFVGIDGDHHFGKPSYLPLVVKPRVPADAAAVIALRWDRPVDFDLQVRSPSGVFLNPKYPTTAPPSGDAAADPSVVGVGRLDHDSLAQCVDDGLRQENVVFTNAPSPGNYTIYANVFDSCRQLGAEYEVSVYVGGVVTKRFYGNLSTSQLPGGYGLGDLVGDITF